MRGLASFALLALLCGPALGQTESSPGVGPQGPPGPAGPQGVAGAKGDKGDAGAAGATGPAGPAGKDGAMGLPGPAGVAGSAGPVGPKGDTGATGPAGAVGATGATGPAGPKGDTGAQGPQGVAGQPGPAGAAGSQGPAGPKASILVCNTTLTDTIAIGLSSGVKSKTGVVCAGVLTTDVLEVYPTAPGTVIEGVAIHHAFPTAAGTLRLVYSVPQVTLLTSLSIPVAIYAVNR